jgi:hypothetical protein
MLMLDTNMRRFPGAAAVGVIIDRRTCLVGLRTTRWQTVGANNVDTGYAVTMTSSSEKPGPVTLFASALYGWAIWWVQNARELSSRPRVVGDVPPPPLELELVEARVSHRVTLSQPERTSWPTGPSRPRNWLDDFEPE